VPANRRKKLVYPGSSIHHELLSPDLRGRMEVIWVTAAPGVDSGDEPHVHDGEETNVVLRGRAEFRVAGRVFALKPGDALTLPASLPHTWRSVGDESLEMIWVSTPPTF
jgi:mannose-6-phosphate isomerase-like protein (cupin superfamily)